MCVNIFYRHLEAWREGRNVKEIETFSELDTQKFVGIIDCENEFIFLYITLHINFVQVRFVKFRYSTWSLTHSFTILPVHISEFRIYSLIHVLKILISTNQFDAFYHMRKVFDRLKSTIIFWFIILCNLLLCIQILNVFVFCYR